MAFKKLKEVVAPGVNPDGTPIRTPRYQKSHTITIHIETTGQLRLLVLIPEFMGEALNRGWKYAGVDLETVQEKKGARDQWAITARDPEVLARAWGDLVHHYSKLITAVKLVPKIRIRRGRDSFGRYNSTGNSASIEVDFDRYLRNSAEPKDRFDSSISDYAWNDELQPMKAIGRRSNDRDWVEVDYDEKLWARLESMRDQIRTAQKRYEELVESGEIVKRLLSGKGPLLLGSDK